MPTSSPRRPLKRRSASWAQGLAQWLAERRVSPNGISLTRLGFAVIGAGAFLATADAAPGARTLLFVVAALAVPFGLDGIALVAALGLVCAGALITAVGRTRAIMRSLGAR